MKKVCALLRIKLFSQQDDTKIVNFDEGVLILYGRFSEAMSFRRFALLSRKSQFTYRNFFIVWLPRVKCLLLLCKTKPALIKRSIHYVTLQHYNLHGGARNSSLYLKRDFWNKKEQILKMALPQKNGSRIKTPSLKSLIFILLEKECSTH